MIWRPTLKCRNQGWVLMRTETPVLNEEICCWIYTINPSKRHRPMAMKVRSRTPVMCMAMAPPDRRERVPTSSGENPSLTSATRLNSTPMTDIIFEVLTEQRP